MAPFPEFSNEGTLGRLAGSWAQLNDRARIEDIKPDPSCTGMLMGVSLGIGLLSTLATAFSFYWFVKMRRSFRHDLIMLLIQADLIKSVWFVIFPVYTFLRGTVPVESDSSFCQVSGFFMALALESSDVAVCLIAIHSAMYIWRPQSGLYPYRWLAYGVYVVVPLLFAGLAFLEGGYENVGYFCYLPNQTGWTRLALSWIPRHVIFAFLIILSVCIYFYIRAKITRYERKGSMAVPSHQHDCAKHSVASETTFAAYRDRICSLPATFRSSISSYYTDTNRNRSATVSNTCTYTRKWTSDILPTGPVLWHVPNFEGDITSAHPEQPAADEQGPGTETAPILCPPAATLSPTRRNLFTLTGTSSPSSSSSSTTNAEFSTYKLPALPEDIATPPLAYTASSPLTRPSSIITIPAMFPVCKKTLAFVTPATSPRPRLPNSPAYDHDPLGGLSLPCPGTTAHNRSHIRRQLRSLFVYPLVYLVIWIFPIVNQAYGYSKGTTTFSPPWLMLCSLVSLAVQGAADSFVFTAREKPWRYTPTTKRTRGDGFWIKLREGRGRNFTMGSGNGAGRTREERLVDERIARARREKERVVEERGRGGAGEGAAGKRRRHWWEGGGFDDDEHV
ncbi:G protein-coupled glucose receptor regulating Gpa2-domain-containing protein [Coniochaeta sp. 2T2.1]|nr:G protein-coupled glucose receptor regulating Gpa2-domain-containing protein [Coniochaeta sp. 2T2.1]